MHHSVITPAEDAQRKSVLRAGGIEHDERAVSGPEKAVKRCGRVSIVSGDGILGAYAHRGSTIGGSWEGTWSRGHQNVAKDPGPAVSTRWAKMGEQQATRTKQITAQIAMDSCVPP